MFVDGYDDVGNWANLTPEEVATLLEGMDAPWWIAGGHAIDLFLDRKLRDHADFDVAVPRRVQPLLRDHLSGWDLKSCRNPSDPSDLKVWEHGDWVPTGDRSVLCRPTVERPWQIEVMLLDILEDEWVLRRNPTVTLELDRVGRRTASGLPYLTPELVLLFKAEIGRRKDQSDLDAVLPCLDGSSRRWLARAIEAMSPRHSWLRQL